MAITAECDVSCHQILGFHQWWNILWPHFPRQKVTMLMIMVKRTTSKSHYFRLLNYYCSSRQMDGYQEWGGCTSEIGIRCIKIPWGCQKLVIYSKLCQCTSSTAQGGGGSFKNRKPIGEVGCCESGMAKRIHWWTERCLRSPLCLFLSLTIYLPTSLSSVYLSIYRSIYLSFSLSSNYLSTYLPIYLSSYLPIYLSTYLSIHLSIYLSICVSVYLSICGAVSFSVL